MKRVFPMLFISFCFGILAVVLSEGTANAKKTAKPPSCNAGLQVFPGDGAGDGPALDYKDNGDGTFTDCNTKDMWEVKTGTPGTPVTCSNAALCPDPHDVNNRYSWSISLSQEPNGSLFTVFLNQLNSSGFAGYSDWCIPNVKRLEGIVDYSLNGPASSVPGETFASLYWSATEDAGDPDDAWFVDFNNGRPGTGFKVGGGHARAVRPCP